MIQQIIDPCTKIYRTDERISAYYFVFEKNTYQIAKHLLPLFLSLHSSGCFEKDVWFIDLVLVEDKKEYEISKYTSSLL